MPSAAAARSFVRQQHLSFAFELLAKTDIFDGKQNQFGLVVLTKEPASIEQHGVTANPVKFLLNLKILKLPVAGK